MSGSRTARPSPPSRNARLGGRDTPEFRGGGLGLFSEQGGRQSAFAEANSNSFQQSNQRQESYRSTTQSNNSRSEATKKFEYSEETRTRARRLTLADCELDLEGTSVLTISPRAGSDVEFEASTVNLDENVGNVGGELVWGGIKFSESCNTIRLERTFLFALCSRTTKDGKTEEYVQAKLNLDDHIAFIMARRRFEAIPPDPAFTEMMSSANWMNLTVITQPDMRSFLKNKAFQDAISGVARRAVEEVMNQMREEMNRAVEEAVARVTAEAEEYVQTEMDTLIKRATKSAAYAGLAQLKIMEIQQRMAYNQFAPFIAAPAMDDEPHSDSGYD